MGLILAKIIATAAGVAVGGGVFYALFKHCTS